MSTDRMSIEEMIGEGNMLPAAVAPTSALPFVVVDDPLPALESMGPLEPEQPVNADAPRLYAITVQGCSAHKVAGYINTQLPEFVADVIAIQFGMHSNVVILLARPSRVERARKEGRW